MKNFRNKNLVSADWLLNNLMKVKVFDGSWHMPSTGRSGLKEFEKVRIPSSNFFDIDLISNKSTNLPHMLPDENTFNDFMNKFGVKNSDHIVVYDTKGIFSSPRVWFTFKLFGHENVSVLDGGYPKWTSFVSSEKEKSLIEEYNKQNKIDKNEKYVSKLKKDHVIDLEYIKSNYVSKKDQNSLIIDARSADRFNSVVDEPRAGLFRGHIPGSANCPFDKMINSDGTLKQNEEILNIIKNSGIQTNKKKLINSCGSGLSACVNIFAMHCAGLDLENLYLYDGSWSEYGLKELKNVIEH